jgi:XRE family transcriptional regulator, regulator of sulfur utilization
MQNEELKHFIGKTMRSLRGSRTLKEFAELTGVSLPYISDLERGRTIPSIATLEKIARACGYRLTLTLSLTETTETTISIEGMLE